MSQFTYTRFVKILQENEHESLDYKIMSNAFDDKGATAELVKDIIAMANNGYKSSFLVYGVSDNRQGFKSVENKKLTELNIQRLCTDWIFPVPIVKVFDEVWNHKGVDEKHKDKRFVIVQIGPNPRQCFRFNREYIDWKEQFHFRKNEVWVRRGSSSDTAHPEEIKRLLEGKDYKDKEVFEEDVNYLEVAKSELLGTLRNDLTEIISKKGGTLEPIPYRREDFAKLAKVSIPFGEEHMNLFVLFVQDDMKEYANKIYFETAEKKLLPEHDYYLILSTASSKKAFVNLFSPEMQLTKSWGNFYVPGGLAYMSYAVRRGSIATPSKIGPFILDMQKVTTKAILIRRFLELYDFLSNPEESKQARELSREMNKTYFE
ncbi:ATP-binding protein [Neobacillus sp.]|uniref:AlbA family DNA-binding domain-containing protein n=1 Tax=Neobacillus sp. TaxID=2675273 RepID=UPI0028A28E1A|nr:ATP-binding protein [Neobacillus sp.]